MKIFITGASGFIGGAVAAVLAALRGSGKRVIHTSGSSLVADNALRHGLIYGNGLVPRAVSMFFSNAWICSVLSAPSSLR
ncbi:hypothetical protein [Achromobacter sp. UMC46]|uniref:hypothetical protein n=1 Tax=Achromobacter sp. UMC46 TaxID=1862319 RepID=UPI001C7E3363|nr:hypothetical protein [Achromobacter sp. UMC46]MBB1597759.1 hypothetical protein [Achromobacter sp. UMC46]